MGYDVLPELVDRAEAFVAPLRAGEGFSEDAFYDLCEVLRRSRHNWMSLDAIPRIAVNILVDLFPSILTCAELYTGEESQQIERAAYEIADLVSSAVPLKE